MKYRYERGLVCAGGVSRTFLGSLPSILKTLGPVVASSMRVSRRMSNLLRAGTPVGDPAPLADCASIWISVPDRSLDAVLASLPSVQGKTVVICGSVRSAVSFATLAAKGANVITINLLDAALRALIADGEKDSVRLVAKVIAKDGFKVIPLLDGTKEMVLAAVDFCTRFADPWFTASIRCFEYSGIPRSQAETLTESLWRTRRRQAEASAKQHEERLLALETLDPRIAGLYRTGAAIA